MDASSIAFPAHELLTHLVLHHGLLLHGTNNPDLEVIEPRPARDFGTYVDAVAAADDGIWPIFYAVVARDRVEGVFTACLHLDRPPRLRRFYMFRVFGADPHDETTWTSGAVYAVARDGFRREWGNEWLAGNEVAPVLRVLVQPSDFPLRTRRADQDVARECVIDDGGDPHKRRSQLEQRGKDEPYASRLRATTHDVARHELLVRGVEDSDVNVRLAAVGRGHRPWKRNRPVRSVRTLPRPREL